MSSDYRRRIVLIIANFRLTVKIVWGFGGSKVYPPRNSGETQTEAIGSQIRQKPPAEQQKSISALLGGKKPA